MKIGALFAGYGGLDLAVEEVFGARTAWVSEFDKGPSKILAARFPHAPNHGDVTKINWAAVEPVDIITGGSPCQDLSHAGKHAGMKAGTRSGLWASMCDAIETIRPKYVVWENVRGALSATADSALESCEFCMDDRGGPSLRALGRVLGDLAELGYDASWCGLRAADVGAPHGRFRIFVLAWDTARPPRLGEHTAAADTDDDGRGQQLARRWGAPVARPQGSSADPLLRTPTAQLAVNGGSQHPDKRKAGGHGPTLADEVEHLLPTPSVADATGGHASRSGTRSNELLLPGIVKTLLPTPSASSPDSRRARKDGTTYSGDGYSREQLGDVLAQDRFGEYTPAIARWEPVLGRPAPSPTEPTGRDGSHRLAPRFVEWLMGLPDGWVTDTDTTRNEQLKALGNGVVPQQAVAALRHMLRVRDQGVTS